MLWVTLLLNLAVSAAKVAVGKLTGSLSMVADGYHSLVDGSNNVVGLIVAVFAYAPPDAGHPYGHRKFETTATLVIGGALLLLAYEVVSGALGRSAQAPAPAVGPLNWSVMLATLATNLYVSAYEAREGRRLGSAYLVADAAHTRSDLYVSLGVIGSFVGVRAGWTWTDSLVAVLIAAVIATQASKILIGAFNVLTDRAALAPEPLLEIVRGVPGVRQCRELRTRGGPNAVHVDLIAHVDGNLALREAHRVADQIESSLKAARPEIVDVVVHLEPAEG